jgi:WD40 repeat protein
VNWASTAGAVVGLLDITAVGKRKTGDPPLIHAHSGALADMQFSPFDNCVLATSGDDATVKLWHLPPRMEDCYSAKGLHSAGATLTGHKRRVDSIAFHPATPSILASSSTDKSLRVWDLNALRCAYALETFTEPVWSACWDWTGALVACTSKDRKIRVVDPRAAAVAQEGAGHEGVKQARVCWMGRHPQLLSTGFDKMNMRQFAVWDARALGKGPLVMRSLGSSTGVSSMMYDGDTDLFFINGKGEGAVRVYEGSAADPWVSEITLVNSAEVSRGICMVPKQCLNLLGNEVDLLLKVGNSAVIPVGFYVPRARRVFQPDLYPDTPSRTPALTTQEWLSGTTKTPVLMQIKPPDGEGEDPFATPSPAQPESTPSSSPEPATSAAAPAASPSPSQAEQHKQAEASRKPPPQIVRYTKFRHIKGQPFMRNTFLNPTFIAVPWSGPGGRVVVLPLNMRGGKVPSDSPFLEHGSEVVDIDTNPFDDSLFATAGEDAHIKLWKIPEGGLKQTHKSPDRDMPGHVRRLNTINFHPTVANLLVSTAADMVVKLWDIEAGSTVAEIAGVHSDTVLNVAWNWTGSMLATSCKDTHLRIFDPRTDPQKPVAEGVAHDGAKGFKVTWAGRKEQQLCTCGFSKSSERVCALWDARDLSKPTATKLLDS